MCPSWSMSWWPSAQLLLGRGTEGCSPLQHHDAAVNILLGFTAYLCHSPHAEGFAHVYVQSGHCSFCYCSFPAVQKDSTCAMSSAVWTLVGVCCCLMLRAYRLGFSTELEAVSASERRPKDLCCELHRLGQVLPISSSNYGMVPMWL